MCACGSRYCKYCGDGSVYPYDYISVTSTDVVTRPLFVPFVTAPPVNDNARGWICPRCDEVNAPSVRRCTCKSLR